MITGPRTTLKLARKLRSEMTLPEGLLWRELRLAIEVDGFAHDTAAGVKRDAARSRFLRSQGVGTLRVPAQVVLRDMGAAVARIVQVCEARTRARDGLPVPLHHAAHGPPPPWGEE